MTAKDTLSPRGYLVLGVWALGRLKWNVKARSPDGSAMVTNVEPQSRQTRRVNARNSNDTRVSLDPQLRQATSRNGASQWIIGRYPMSNLGAALRCADFSMISRLTFDICRQKLHGV
jgi:hypothetical protein